MAFLLLLIAAIAIVHVFISHFAVGGGLFLVLAERKARRDQDPALLEYVGRHSKSFVLLTLVGGAITGVGTLVHDCARASGGDRVADRRVRLGLGD